MAKLELDFTRLFRKLGKEQQEAYARGLEARRDDRDRESRAVGPVAGSLPALVRNPGLLRVTRWGFVLQLSKVGQKLTWYVRGTSRQRARKPRGAKKLNRREVQGLVQREAVRQVQALEAGSRRWR